MTDEKEGDGFYIENASYKGNEENVLTIRNRNRDYDATIEYLNWRYTGLKSEKEPVIFFVKKFQNIVGMASIIYRSYRIKGQKIEVPILGDISIDKDLRGKGVAGLLFIHINKFLNENNIPFAFVLPNIAAKKSLLKECWKTQEELVRYVFFLNPKRALKKSQNNAFIGEVCRFASYLIRFYLYLRCCNDIEMRSAYRFGNRFDRLWLQIHKLSLITKERSAKYLTWRYLEHPFDPFQIYEFYQINQFIGYIVAKYTKEEDSISIYEVFARNENDLASMLRYFLYKCSHPGKIHSVRITLNKQNPYHSILRKTLFIKRPTDNVFQTYGLSEDLSESKWLITTGDKDV